MLDENPKERAKRWASELESMTDSAMLFSRLSEMLSEINDEPDEIQVRTGYALTTLASNKFPGHPDYPGSFNPATLSHEGIQTFIRKYAAKVKANKDYLHWEKFKDRLVSQGGQEVIRPDNTKNFDPDFERWMNDLYI